jgi:hypothetical protein
MVNNKFLIILTLLVYNTYAAAPNSSQIFCSAFCAPLTCQGWTPADCNNKCNTGIGWTGSGGSCSVTGPGYQFLDSSDDSGGMIVPSPYIFTVNCLNLTNYLPGMTAPYGDYTVNQQVNITLAGGTSIPHYGISLIFDIILVDIDSTTPNNRWKNTAIMTSTLYNPNSTQPQSINLNNTSPSTNYKGYCGDTGKN